MAVEAGELAFPQQASDSSKRPLVVDASLLRATATALGELAPPDSDAAGTSRGKQSDDASEHGDRGDADADADGSNDEVGDGGGRGDEGDEDGS